MKKNYWAFLALIVSSVLCVNAGQIDEQQALDIARQFSVENLGTSIKTSVSKMTVAYTAKSENRQANLLYVVERGSGSGFVVVAGDDAIGNPVLGYSDRGEFDYENAPDNLKWWLGEYGRLIDYVATNGIVSVAEVPTFDRTTEPLIKTKWNQYEPYNELCPKINGERTVTGCVATATAQLMKYYEWPASGTGSKSYVWNGETLSSDFGAHTYQWGLMDDVYDGTNSDAANEAVAQLMYDCGIAAEMNYDLAINGGSGASYFTSAKGLIDYFGYSKAMLIKQRDYYTYGEWVTMVKDEIDAERPVYYSAQSTGGGHAFILDGYNSDGYFHVNWGWGGISDGYFSIVALDPDNQGAGAGSDSGFRYEQSAFFDCVPSKGTEDYVPLFYMNDFSLSQINGDNLEKVDKIETSKGNIVYFYLDRVGNNGMSYFSGYLGVAITDDSGNVVSLYDGNAEIDSYYYYQYYYLDMPIPTDLGDGHYRAYPVCYENRGDEPIKINAYAFNSQYIDITVSGDDVVLTNQEKTMSHVTFDKFIFTQNEDFNNGQYSYLEFEVTNGGEEYYNGQVGLVLLDNDTYSVAYPTTVYVSYVSVAPGTSQTVTVATPVQGFSRDNDLYQLAIYEGRLNNFFDVFMPININNPDISLFGTPQITNPNPENLILTATFENTSSVDYMGFVGAKIFDSNGNIIKTIDAEHVEIAANGKSETVTFTGTVKGLNEDETYYIYFYDNSTQLSPGIKYALQTTTGVENVASVSVGVYPNPVEGMLNVSAENVIDNVVIYNIAGTQVMNCDGVGANDLHIDMSGLSAGTYFVRVATEAGSSVEKVIKK